MVVFQAVYAKQAFKDKDNAVIYYSLPIFHAVNTFYMRFIGLITTIPQLIVLIAVLMYVSRRATAEGMLMLIGSFIGVIASAFNIVGIPWLFERYGSDWYASYGMIIGAVHTLGGLCFAIGLLILIQNVLRTKP